MEGVNLVVMTADEFSQLKGMVTDVADIKKVLLSKEDKPAISTLGTLTMEDIKRIYGVTRTKWRDGVRNGIFPEPLKGFDRPKRWSRAAVERVLGDIGDFDAA